MTARLRVGLIGTGWVAHQHVAGYRSVADELVEVAAICDPRRDVLDSFGERYGISARFETVDELMKSGELDAVVLLTPPAVREEIIDPALERGIHLLVEKPFATTGALAVRYAEQASAAGVTMAVSQNFRWFPEYQWLAARLGRGDAGELRSLEARSFQNRPQAPGQWRAEQTKLEMAIYSIHLIDRLQWLARARPVDVNAVTRRNPDSSVGGEQYSSLLIRFENGAVADMTSSWMSKALPEQSLRVDTSTGSAGVRRELPMHGDAHGSAVFGDSVEQEEFVEAVDSPHGSNSYGWSMREFALAIREGREPSHSATDNLKTMGIMEAAYLSAARNGATVTTEEALAG